MEVFSYVIIFFVILIGSLCIIIGNEAERFSGIAILFMVSIDILLFNIIKDNILGRDFSNIISDSMRFLAFLAISLRSVKIWPTLCSGVLLTMVSASIFKILNLPVGVFDGEGVRIACHLTVYATVSIGLWRNNTVRR